MLAGFMFTMNKHSTCKVSFVVKFYKQAQCLIVRFFREQEYSRRGPGDSGEIRHLCDNPKIIQEIPGLDVWRFMHLLKSLGR